MGTHKEEKNLEPCGAFLTTTFSAAKLLTPLICPIRTRRLHLLVNIPFEDLPAPVTEWEIDFISLVF